MARPLRTEFPGALYHITARGDRQEAIYEDQEDREQFLRLLGEVVEESRWLCHAYCLMTNHYHLVIETPEGNLSKGIRQLNGVYTQAYNRRHRQVGHLFQGRYKAILVEADRYLLELVRYVVLNPVRAGMVSEPEDWAWSSYNPTVGQAVVPPWLAVDALLGQFADKGSVARQRYRRFVRDGVRQGSIWSGLNRQIYLGDDRFVERMQAQVKPSSDDVNIPKVQRRGPAASLSQIEAAHENRAEAMVAAHAAGEYSYQQIAAHFGVHFTTVGRYVRAAKQGKTCPWNR